MKVGILINLKVGGSAYEEIAKAQAQGFDNAQISVWNMALYNDDTVADVKRACETFHFTVTAVWCGWTGPIDWSYPNMYVTLGLIPPEWRAKRVEELLRGAAFAQKLGVTDIVTHVGYLPDNPFHPDRVGVAAALKYICKELDTHGQRFLFETGEELPISLVHLITDIGADNIGINFDPANMMMNGRGTCPSAALEFLLPYVCGFHAKDAKKPVAPECKKIEVPVGYGDVDFPRLVALLKEAGYTGSLTIEHEKLASPTRDKEVLEAKAYLEKLITAN